MKPDNLICGIGCIILIILVLTVYATCAKSDLSGFTPFFIVLATSVVGIGLTTVLGLLKVSIVIYILVLFSTIL